jgi:hypothetical protein
MTITGYQYHNSTPKESEASKESDAQHPDDKLLCNLYNCDMFTLTEIFESIAFAQSEAIMDIASNPVCCDIDTVADDYPE